MAKPARLLRARRADDDRARRRGGSAFRWSACWPGCCSALRTGCPAAARSGAVTRLGWWTWSAWSSPTVDRLNAERDRLANTIDSTHGRSSDTALAAMLRRSAELAGDAGLDPVHGPGLIVTLNDAQRDANGRFPRDASPDDLVVHQQDIQAVLNALWSAGAEAIQMQDQRIIATSAPRCVGNTLLLNGRTYSPPYTITAIGDAAAMQAALAAAPLVILYKQYVVRFGLGYTEQVTPDVRIAGYSEPVRMHFAQPAGPVSY